MRANELILYGDDQKKMDVTLPIMMAERYDGQIVGLKWVLEEKNHQQDDRKLIW